MADAIKQEDGGFEAVEGGVMDMVVSAKRKGPLKERALLDSG